MPTIQGFEGVAVQVGDDGALERVWAPDGTVGHFCGHLGAEALVKIVTPEGNEQIYGGPPGRETLRKIVWHREGYVEYPSGKRV